eukprot:3748245-Prorocentrum_lima.AAC.1
MKHKNELPALELPPGRNIPPARISRISGNVDSRDCSRDWNMGSTCPGILDEDSSTSKNGT